MPHKSSRLLAISAIAVTGLSLSGCFTEEIDARQTHEIQGLLYKIHDDEPFTGRVTGYPMSVLGVFSVGSCTVDLKKGLPHGEMHCSDNAGTLLASGEFEGGTRNGKEEKFDPKTGEMTHRNQWQNGKQHGVQKEFNPTTGTLIAEVDYQDGQKSGSEKYWDADGDTLIASLDWDQGKPTGFDNRGDMHRNLVDGRPHGVQKSFRVEGNRYYLASEENYDQGERDGVQKTLDSRGNVLEESLYEKGVLKSRTLDKYTNGVRLQHLSLVQTGDAPERWDQERTLANHGVEQRWDSNANLTHELHWNRGKLVSATRSVWLNGQLDSQLQGVGEDSYGMNQRVLKHGVERLFDEQGELLALVEWNAGKPTAAATRLPRMLQEQHPGKMAALSPASLQDFNSPIRAVADFFANSTYAETFGQSYDHLIDTPTPGAALASAPVAEADAAPGKSQTEVDACVAQRVDAVHQDNPDALIRYDMLEEFEQECR